jgi:hypothetical protein
MTTALLVRRFLADHARNPVNLLVLAAVPVVFVVVAADPLASVGRALGGSTGAAPVETITAGWAAGFVAAVGAYFQLASARHTDRRLVLAGLPRRTLVRARLLAGASLGAFAALVALVALASQGPVDDPFRVVAGTVLFATIYLALGALVASVVTAPLNATMTLLFIWIIDVFFGPAMNGTDEAALRLLPTHFVTLWTANLAPQHGGPEPLPWALTWTAASLVIAYAAVRRSAAVGGRRLRVWSEGPSALTRAALRMAWRRWRRNPTLWVLLVVIPVVFIWLADALTPTGSTPVRLRENGSEVVTLLDPAHMHAGTMAPIAIGSLAALAGVFISLDAAAADHRLLLAGAPVRVIWAVRLSTLAGAAAVATVASLVVTSLLFEPHQWPFYAAANLLVGLTYAAVGALIGPLVGRVSGSLLAFLLPFLDLAIGQSPMLQSGPARWAEFLPGWGASRVLLDGALTEVFDEGGALVVGLGWLALLVVVASLRVRSGTRSAEPSPQT